LTLLETIPEGDKALACCKRIGYVLTVSGEALLKQALSMPPFWNGLLPLALR
jgi:hypothetical protein